MSLPKTQKALLATEIGKPLTLVSDHPVPNPGPGQVLLKVTTAGLNPHDSEALYDGLFIKDALPAILANDVVGTVVALGPNVTKYSIGDRVLSHASFIGTYDQDGLQEYAINDIDFGFKIPESVTDSQAATLPTNVIAPLFGYFHTEKGLGIPAPWSVEAKSFDYKNASLLIVGGGSSTGKFGVQLASLANIGTIIVVGGDETELRKYGATHILNRHDSTEVILQNIKSVVGDELIYAFDAVNPPAGQILGLNALSSHKKGKLARLLPLGPVDESKVLGKQAGFEVIDVFGASNVAPNISKPFWERVPDLLLSGKLTPLKAVDKPFSVENVNEVLEAYRDRKRVVKTHLVF